MTTGVILGINLTLQGPDTFPCKLVLRDFLDPAEHVVVQQQDDSVAATLLAKETDVTEGYTRTMYNESVPYLGRSKALSLSMFVKSDDVKSGSTIGNLIAKGEHFQVQLDKGIPTVQISTEQGVNSIKSTSALLPK